MNCFPCFQSQKSKKANKNVERAEEPIRSSETKSPKPGVVDKVHEETTLTSPPTSTSQKPADQSGNINAQTFTFRELASATKNFRQECLLGEGGFGRVYKGTLQSNGQVVAVKQLDRNGMHGNKEFLVEVMMLSLLHHPNLVKLIGYCADGDQRLLVYEFMAGGSVEDHILASSTEEKRPLDWMTRMKIAYGAAQGLEYLHDKANPPVIYRDLKSSNILLDENLEPKLSDVGLAKFGPLGDKMQASSRVMRTYGYSAPEYTRSSQFTIKSDVYSFGVVLLELITGRRVIDTTRPVDEQNLIAWAQPIFRDPKRFPDMADPLLKKRFPERSLNQAVAIAAMCLQEEPGARPLMSDAVTALGFLAKSTEPIPDPLPLPEEKSDDEDGSDYNDDDEEGDSDYDDDDDGESEEQVEGESLAQENDDVKNESNSGLKSSSSRSLDKISRSGMESNNETSTTTSGTPRKKKSQKLRSSSTHKNRKASNEEGSSSSQQKCSKSLASLNRKGSRKSKMGSASSSRKSNKKSAEQ